MDEGGGKNIRRLDDEPEGRDKTLVLGEANLLPVLIFVLNIAVSGSGSSCTKLL